MSTSPPTTHWVFEYFDRFIIWLSYEKLPTNFFVSSTTEDDVFCLLLVVLPRPGWRKNRTNLWVYIGWTSKPGSTTHWLKNAQYSRTFILEKKLMSSLTRLLMSEEWTRSITESHHSSKNSIESNRWNSNQWCVKQMKKIECSKTSKLSINLAEARVKLRREFEL